MKRYESLAAAELRLSPLELVLLDGAALEPCAFWVFRDAPYVSPAGMAREVPADTIAAALRGLWSRGLITVHGPGPDTSVEGWSDDGVVRAVDRWRRGDELPTDYRLTDAGGQAWTSYRRPIWDWFVQWVVSGSDLLCVAGARQTVLDAAGDVARAADHPTLWPEEIQEIHGWRETYWRAPRTGYFVALSLDGGDDDVDLKDVASRYPSRALSDVLGLGGLRSLATTPWLRGIGLEE